MRTSVWTPHMGDFSWFDGHAAGALPVHKVEEKKADSRSWIERIQAWQDEGTWAFTNTPLHHVRYM